MRALALAALLTIAAAPADQFTVADQPFAQSDILDARVIADGAGAPIILVTMAPEAAERLAQISRANIGKPAALALGGRVLTSAVVSEPITDGTLQIPGIAGFAEAARIARRISGKAPLPESLDD